MRVAGLLCLLACKGPATTETSKPGSAAVAVSTDAARETRPLPKLAGTPPVKTTRPLDAARARALAKLDFAGFTREVRNADDRNIDVRYLTATRPAIEVGVIVAPCFDCPPMEESRWRAKSDALRYVIGPELKDHRDTTWELGMTELAGTPYAWTYHVGYDPNGSYATAYAIHYNDGVNMIRVVAAYKDAAPSSRDALLAMAPKQDLERTAKAFVDAFVHAW